MSEVDRLVTTTGGESSVREVSLALLLADEVGPRLCFRGIRNEVVADHTRLLVGHVECQSVEASMVRA